MLQPPKKIRPPRSAAAVTSSQICLVVYWRRFSDMARCLTVGPPCAPKHMAKGGSLIGFTGTRPNSTFDKTKPPGFARAVFRFTNQISYSPLPKRRDHQPARRGWVSSAAPGAVSAGVGAGGAVLGRSWQWATGGGRGSGWAGARPSLAAGRLIGARRARLLLGFVLVGFAVVHDRAGNRWRVGRNARNFALVTHRRAVARLAGTAAPPPPPLALVAIRIGFAVACLADRRIVDQPFGLFGFHLRLGFDVERLFLVGGFFDIGRESRNLGRQQRLGGLQRMHLLAAIDDERLLAADSRVGDDSQRHLEAVFEIA